MFAARLYSSMPLPPTRWSLVAYTYSPIGKPTIARALDLFFIALTKINPVWLHDHPRVVVQPLLICTGVAYAYEKISQYFPIQLLEAERGGREVIFLPELTETSSKMNVIHLMLFQHRY